MPSSRRGRPMNCSITEPEQPRLVSRTIVALNESSGTIRRDVSGISIHQVRLPPTIKFQNLPREIRSGVLRIFRSVPEHLMIPVTAETTIDAGMPHSLRGPWDSPVGETLPGKTDNERNVHTTGAGSLHAHRLNPCCSLPASRLTRPTDVFMSSPGPAAWPATVVAPTSRKGPFVITRCPRCEARTISRISISAGSSVLFLT